MNNSSGAKNVLINIECMSANPTSYLHLAHFLTLNIPSLDYCYYNWNNNNSWRLSNKQFRINTKKVIKNDKSVRKIDEAIGEIDKILEQRKV